jgi:hypothetical protein
MYLAQIDETRKSYGTGFSEKQLGKVTTWQTETQMGVYY